MRVLVIAPHPDDEVLGCGGVMARHADHGDEVYVLVLTRAIPDVLAPEVVEQCRRELREAHELLGVSGVQLLDYPAPALESIPKRELADAIRQALLAFQPELVYLPHRGDIHNDHREVYYATLVAARPINNCPVRRLLCYETLSETEWAPPFGDDTFIPTVFVDISSYLDRKIEAMACYRTLLRTFPHPRSLQTIRALARWRGSTVGLPAAEAFVLVREIVKQ